jgi:tetratricopeptide (TPR) repeat protein
MKALKTVTHLSMLITTPSFFAYPQSHVPQVIPQKVNWFGDWWWGTQEQVAKWVHPTTYDEIMQMLDDLESGELERRYPPEQLERVNEYLATLAKEGILPNEFDEEADLEEDSYDLLYGEDSGFQLACYLESSSEYMIIPAVLSGYSGYNIVQCGKISKAWKKTKKFCKKHKKAIIIGAVVVIAVAAVAVAVVIVSSASAASAAAGVAGAAGAVASGSGSGSSSSSKPEPRGSSSSTSSGPQTSSNETPIFKSAMEDQISSFKENLAHENFFGPSSTNGQGLSLEETGRVVGPLFAHDSFNHFNDHLSSYPQLSQELQSMTSHPDFPLPPGASDNPVGFGHDEIDKRFASDYGAVFSNPAQEVNCNALSYQMRGDAARYYGYYGQAVNDFTKAINMNPTDPMPYLHRSASYFDMGQYDNAIKDFNSFTSQIEKAPQNNIPQSMDLSASDLAFAFARGMSKGACIAVKDLTSFFGNFVTHPIRTSTQFVQSISMLVDLTKNNEWGQIADCLVPEARQLINEWGTFPWDERLERSGTIFTQYGGQIFLTGGAAKATATLTKMGAKGVQNVARAAQGFKMAKETFFLEAAAEIGNGARVGEIVASGRNTLFLGEELGFTAKEMGHLKQAGKLETTLQKKFNHLSLTEQESIKLFKNAEEQLISCHGRYMPEAQVRQLIHSTGIPTFSRPQGIPQNYKVKLSDKPGGMKYVHPQDEGTYVRIMPGKAHSQNPCQQKPYVNQRIHGKSLDKHGNIVSNKSKEAHIPLEEFVYKEVGKH